MKSNNPAGHKHLAKCDLCGSFMPSNDLNYEAQIHHRAQQLECMDRKACGRRKRKNKKWLNQS